MLAAVRLRKLKSVRGGPFDNFCVTPEVLEAAIKTDRANGLIPFMFIMTLGTTSTCAFDPLEQLAPICQKEDMWVHVDAAYAEYRFIGNGLKFADSFNMNAHKTMQVTFDCSPMWLVLDDR
ncbi:unnamed protein product [Gongylonema pulchrum]|uniref:Aromatic-L-amino-acid decarboxylase n=1 Tax=Gongylonema pulchrum TaxID=637853 RepID=A0A183D525_9BILA|nr:unnamed protein product [Gongylonema pulchrum]